MHQTPFLKVNLTAPFHQDSIGIAKWLLNPSGLPMTHFDRFFMPHMTRVDYNNGDNRHFVISSQINPMAYNKSMREYTANGDKEIQYRQ